jgi:hypothetical protein
LNTLPELPTYSSSLLVLGLVCIRFWKLLLLTCAPHGGHAAFQSRYPINFVVKHPNPLLSPKWASPEAVETCHHPKIAACFQIEVPNKMLKAPIWKQLNDDLVELTGIEPVTPCLQSRCSPS